MRPEYLFLRVRMLHSHIEIVSDALKQRAAVEYSGDIG
jgi:hypothetical protein